MKTLIAILILLPLSVAAQPDVLPDVSLNDVIVPFKTLGYEVKQSDSRVVLSLIEDNRSKDNNTIRGLVYKKRYTIYLRREKEKVKEIEVFLRKDKLSSTDVKEFMSNLLSSFMKDELTKGQTLDWIERNFTSAERTVIGQYNLTMVYAQSNHFRMIISPDITQPVALSDVSLDEAVKHFVALGYKSNRSGYDAILDLRDDNVPIYTVKTRYNVFMIGLENGKIRSLQANMTTDNLNANSVKTFMAEVLSSFIKENQTKEQIFSWIEQQDFTSPSSIITNTIGDYTLASNWRTASFTVRIRHKDDL